MVCLALSIPREKAKGSEMRTLTAYGIGVVIVLAILNSIGWLVGSPRLHSLNVFSAGFVLGVFGTYISAWLNGYRRFPDALRS